MTQREKLTEEVHSLLTTIANLGNTTDEMTTAECNKENKDFVEACEWNSLLDRLFEEVHSFAEGKNIETL